MPDQVTLSDESVSPEVSYYGYRFLITESRSDSTYHDRCRVRLEIRQAGSEAALHVIEHSSRSTHQLSKRYRTAASERDRAITEAQGWVLANRPDANALREAEIRHARRERFEAVGRDPLAYILSCQLELSVTDVGTVLQLGTARKLNRLLCDWGVQRKDDDGGYDPVNPAHGRHVGLYGQLPVERRGAEGDLGRRHTARGGRRR